MVFWGAFFKKNWGDLGDEQEASVLSENYSQLSGWWWCWAARGRAGLGRAARWPRAGGGAEQLGQGRAGQQSMLAQGWGRR